MHPDRRARVGKEKPRPLLVAAEYLGDPVRPAREERRRQPRLEGLHRSARLEPRNAVGERHAQHRRPRPLALRLDRADRLDVRAEPAFGGGTVHSVEADGRRATLEDHRVAPDAVLPRDPLADADHAEAA